MKKLLVALLALLAVVSACLGSVAFAEEPSVAAADPLSAEEFVKQLCALNKEASGTANSDGAKSRIRTFISEQLKASLGNDSVQEISFSDKETRISGFNIEGKLETNAEQRIVIGAHYDATDEGAADNAVGVAVLMQVAKRLAENKARLPFDVYFVAFDCEEDGLIGSAAYINQIGSNSKFDNFDNILLMFNVDSVAVGDMYLFCENKHTALADLILSKCDAQEKPYAKGVYGEMDVYGYGYYENIQGTDHTPFRLNGIPTALLFAGDYGLLGYEYGNTINTSNDTFENLVKANPNYVQRIADAAAIADTVLDDSFEEIALNARKQIINNNAVYNSLWPALAVLGVLVVLAIFVWLYYRKLQKRAILGTGEIKTNKVFDKPDAEDIFSFDGTSGGKGEADKSDSSDIDDIFTFKR